MTPALHHSVVLLQLAAAFVTFFILLWQTAPYGRHHQPWGPTLPANGGWVVMEMPAVAWFSAVFFAGDHSLELVPLVLFGLWQVHYVHRTFVYPLRNRSGNKSMPVVVVLMGMLFQLVNAYINAAWIGHIGTYASDWLLSPAFIIGATLFAVGFAVNVHSDSVLFNLRKPGDDGYHIPERGAWRWLSAPNYAGELLEWIGWAVATWSLAGFAFALFTAANLVPRAMANHRWYHETFPDYPPERRRLLPFLF